MPDAPDDPHQQRGSPPAQRHKLGLQIASPAELFSKGEEGIYQRGDERRLQRHPHGQNPGIHRQPRRQHPRERAKGAIQVRWKERKKGRHANDRQDARKEPGGQPIGPALTQVGAQPHAGPPLVGDDAGEDMGQGRRPHDPGGQQHLCQAEVQGRDDDGALEQPAGEVDDQRHRPGNAKSEDEKDHDATTVDSVHKRASRG